MVDCVIDTLGEPTRITLTFVNSGRNAALNVDYFFDAGGAPKTGSVPDIAPGESVDVSVPLGAKLTSFKLVWTCRDAHGRRHVWSDDGRHRHLGRRAGLAAGDAFELMYPASR